MITNRDELKEYIKYDEKANHFSKWSRLINTRCKFLRTLRELEYCININAPKPVQMFYRLRLQLLSEKLGITIGPNVFGKGLYLPHYGSIVINDSARFGENCVVQNGVNVSESVVCGGGIYLGAGSKLLIGVHLADNIIVGANAVVTKSFDEPNIVIAGVPAKKISEKGTESGRVKI